MKQKETTELITPAKWPAPSHIRAFTTLRAVNITKSSDRHQLQTRLQLPHPPLFLNQTHSNIVIDALDNDEKQSADAVFTDHTETICMILTADCLPLLLCNRQGTKVAAIHAGWRGLASDIIQATLRKLAIPSNELYVWLGPAIGPCHFEIGSDVYDLFLTKNNQNAIAFTPINKDKWLANIYMLAKIQLQSAGITQIYGGDFCTYHQTELFCSYRAQPQTLIRLASFIWIAATIADL